MKFKRIIVVLLLGLIVVGCNNSQPSPPYTAELLYVFTNPFWVNGTTSITAEVLGDDGNGSISKPMETTFDYYIDGTLTFSEVATHSVFEWNTNNYADGIHKILIKAKTLKSELEETEEINVQHYFPQIMIYTYDSYLRDIIYVDLKKWEETQFVTSNNATVSVNGVDLVINPTFKYYQVPDPYYAWSRPGDKVTVSIQPFDSILNTASIEIPYPFKNFQTSDIQKWINKEEANLVVNWELPKSWLNYVDIYLYCYDSSGNYISPAYPLGRLDDESTGSFPTSYTISNSHLNPGTAYITLRFEYYRFSPLGFNAPNAEWDNPSASICAETDSRISNLPFNFVEKEKILFKNQFWQGKLKNK